MKKTLPKFALYIALSFIYIIISLNAHAEDIITVCNSCSTTQIKNAALQSSPNTANVHVVDLKMGQVTSFAVEHEFEPGFEMHLAMPIATPNDIEVAAQEVNSFISDIISNGGSYDEYSNILTQTVNIPSEIASTSIEMRDYLKSQAVSNYLRLKLLSSVWSQLDKAWKMLTKNMIFKIKVKFQDDTTAIYALRSAVISDHPFKLEKNSIKDANGNLISSGNSSGNDGLSYGAIYSGGGSEGTGIYRKCRNYTINSGGYSWGGIVCWFTRTP